MWGEEWKGVKFPHLYILLREQFAHPDDPWCKETLDWWNKLCFSSAIHPLYAYNLLGKCSVAPPRPMKMHRKWCGMYKAHPCKHGWKMNSKQGCEQQLITEGIFSKFLKSSQMFNHVYWIQSSHVWNCQKVSHVPLCHTPCSPLPWLWHHHSLTWLEVHVITVHSGVQTRKMWFQVEYKDV